MFILTNPNLIQIRLINWTLQAQYVAYCGQQMPSMMPAYYAQQMPAGMVAPMHGLSPAASAVSVTMPASAVHGIAAVPTAALGDTQQIMLQHQAATQVFFV